MDKILSILLQDARITPAQIAEMTNKDLAEVEAKIADYEKKGIILGYKSVINWDKTGSDYVTALIEVKVTPQKGMGFDEIAKQIYNHPQVESLYLMSGAYDFMVIIVGKSLKDVAHFVSDQISTIDCVISTATHFILKKYKDQGVKYEQSVTDRREALRL